MYRIGLLTAAKKSSICFLKATRWPTSPWLCGWPGTRCTIRLPITRLTFPSGRTALTRPGCCSAPKASGFAQGDGRQEEKLSVKDKQEQNAYRMLLEMQQRGIRMLPVDLYKSHASRFLPENGALRCPFTSVSGFGEAAVQGILETRDPQKPYLSVEDLRLRARLGTSAIDMLRQQGALEGLPETSQVDLFSFL